MTPCEFCLNVATHCINGLWVCPDHILEGVSRTLRLEAFKKDAPIHIANSAIPWAMEAIGECGEIGGEFEIVRMDNEGHEDS